jgi:Family of unknown function (DUF6308)/Protein of unknown function (DUF3293)
MMSNPPSVANLYLKTNVTVEIDAEWVSAFDVASSQVAPIHVITAWNPGEGRPSREENDDANFRLHDDIRSLGCIPLPALGSDPDSDHAEESWAVFGLEDDQAMDLGRRYGQVAVFRVSEARQTVLGCDMDWRISRGSRIPIGTATAAAWINDTRRRDHLQDLLDRYYGDLNPGYEGRQFEWFIRRSQSSQFTEADLMAIGALSVSVPPSTARLLIEDPTKSFARLLERCDDEVIENQDLATKSWLWRSGSAFNALFEALSDPILIGVGKVVRSKLMAAKFPALVPIRDSRVESILGMSNSHEWWKPIHELLASTEATLTQLEIRDDSFVVTPLRKLDVILWMEATDREL